MDIHDDRDGQDDLDDLDDFDDLDDHINAGKLNHSTTLMHCLL